MKLFCSLLANLWSAVTSMIVKQDNDSTAALAVTAVPLAGDVMRYSCAGLYSLGNLSFDSAAISLHSIHRS